jgi:hypothetical protein
MLCKLDRDVRWHDPMTGVHEARTPSKRYKPRDVPSQR